MAGQKAGKRRRGSNSSMPARKKARTTVTAPSEPASSTTPSTSPASSSRRKLYAAASALGYSSSGGPQLGSSSLQEQLPASSSSRQSSSAGAVLGNSSSEGTSSGGSLSGSPPSGESVPAPSSSRESTPVAAASENSSSGCSSPRGSRQGISPSGSFTGETRQRGIHALPRCLVEHIFRTIKPSGIKGLREMNQRSGFANAHEQYMYRTITITPHPDSVKALQAIANDPVKRQWVRGIVYQDLFPKTEAQLMEDFPVLAEPDNAVVLSSYRRVFRDQFVAYRDNPNTSAAINQAVGRFNNLEHVEFCSGWWDVPEPGRLHDQGITFVLRPNVLRHHMQVAYRQRIWDDRASQRIFTTPQSDNDDWQTTSISHFDGIVQAALGNPNVSKIDLRFDTVHRRALEDNLASWPTGKVTSLDFVYRTDMSDDTALMEGDWAVIRRNAVQFEAVERLYLAGRSFETTGRLAIRTPGGYSNFPSPDLSALRKVVLRNVDLDDGAVKYFKDRPIDLDVQNIACDNPRSFVQSHWSRQVPMFRGVFAVNNPGGNMVGVHTRNMPHPDEVWFIGSKEEAVFTAEKFWPFVSDKSFPRNLEQIPHVSRSTVEEFIVGGGPVPFRRDNMWTQTYLYDWRS